MRYVVSTLTRPITYAFWEPISASTSGAGRILRGILVNGGAGLATPVGTQMYTPDGVRTEVTNEEAELLLTHKQFKEHMERGFVKIITTAKDPDTVAQDMESKDGSRPQTPTDVENFAKKMKKPDQTTLSVVTNRKRA